MGLKLFLLAFVLLACSVNALPVNVSDCTNFTVANKYYQLNKSVSSADHCFYFVAENVTLDCNGFTVNYSSVSHGYGAYVSGYIFNNSIINCVFNQTSSNSNSDGIHLNDDSTSAGTISNNSIITRGSTSYGISVYAGSSVGVNAINISYNNISTAETNGFGIYLVGVKNATLFGNNVNTSGTNAYGIVLSTCVNNSLSYNNISTSGASNGVGAYVSLSDYNNFTGNTIKTSGNSYCYGVWFSDSTSNLFKDSVINASGAGVADVYSNGAGINNLTNCSFDKTDTSISSSSSINVFWFVDARVVDWNNVALNGAYLNASDVYGASVLNATTNSTGWIPRATIQEYYQTSTGVYNYTNHDFNASSTTNYASNKTAKSVSSSGAYTFQLTPLAAKIFVSSNATTYTLGETVSIALNLTSGNASSLVASVVNVTIYNSTGWNSTSNVTTNATGEGLVTINGLSTGAYSINASVYSNSTANYSYAVNNTETFAVGASGLLQVIPNSMSFSVPQGASSSLEFNLTNIGGANASSVGCWEGAYSWVSVSPLNVTYGNMTLENTSASAQQVTVLLSAPPVAGSFSTTVYCNATGLPYANVTIAITVTASSTGGGGGGYPPVVNASFLVYPTEITPPLFSSAVSGSLIRLSDVFILNFGNSSIDLTSSFKCSSAEGCAADWCSLNRSTPSFSLASQQTEVLQTFCRIPLNTINGYYYSTLVIEQSSTGLQQGVKVTLKVGGDVVSDSLDYGSDLFSGLFEPLTACVVSLGEAREGCLVNAGAAFDIAGIHVASIQLWVLLAFVVVALGVFFTVL